MRKIITATFILFAVIGLTACGPEGEKADNAPTAQQEAPKGAQSAYQRALERERKVREEREQSGERPLTVTEKVAGIEAERAAKEAAEGAEKGQGADEKR